jgi:hypothetical protein
MTNGNRRRDQLGQIRPASMEINQIDCHFSPQSQINSYRLQWRSLGLTSLAERIKLLRGTFDSKGQIGAGPEINFCRFQESGGSK